MSNYETKSGRKLAKTRLNEARDLCFASLLAVASSFVKDYSTALERRRIDEGAASKNFINDGLKNERQRVKDAFVEDVEAAKMSARKKFLPHLENLRALESEAISFIDVDGLRWLQSVSSLPLSAHELEALRSECDSYWTEKQFRLLAERSGCGQVAEPSFDDRFKLLDSITIEFEKSLQNYCDATESSGDALSEDSVRARAFFNAQTIKGMAGRYCGSAAVKRSPVEAAAMALQTVRAQGDAYSSAISLRNIWENSDVATRAAIAAEINRVSSSNYSIPAEVVTVASPSISAAVAAAASGEDVASVAEDDQQDQLTFLSSSQKARVAQNIKKSLEQSKN